MSAPSDGYIYGIPLSAVIAGGAGLIVLIIGRKPALI